jgi:hypothetical protein
VSGRTRDVDWAASYFDGFDPNALFDLELQIARIGAQNPEGLVEVDALASLRSVYRRFRSLGLDGAMNVGDLALRFEGAWLFRKPFPFTVAQATQRVLTNPQLISALVQGEEIRVPLFVERDAFEWGISFDYLIRGFFILLELDQLLLVRNDQDLLFPDVDTRIVARVQRFFLRDSLSVELQALWAFEASYQFLKPEVTYEITDSISVDLGAIGIWGSADSLLGQYKRNSEAYARIRYSF